MGLTAGEEQPGVLLHLLPLKLVAQQVLGLGAVRVGHGDELPILPQEGTIPGIEPGTVLPIELGEGVKVEGGGGAPPGQPC